MIIIKVIDYHVHSDNSFDGKSDVDNICQEGIKKGVREICFTEHFSVDPRDVSFGVLDYSKYTCEINEARKKYEKHLLIKKGLEIGEPHLTEYKDDLENFIRKTDLDFIIGSVHNINGVKLRLFMKNKKKYNVYQDYFEEIYKMAETADIDVIGHLDMMKRYAYAEYGNFHIEDHAEIIRSILKKIIQRKIGLEINCSGLSHDVNEIYPKVEILKLYKELGGEILTIGSDSHNSENIASNNANVMEILKKTGFYHIYTYENRKKHLFICNCYEC